MNEHANDIDNIGYLLLDALQEANVISESSKELLKSEVRLMESTSESNDDDILMESRSTPFVYVMRDTKEEIHIGTFLPVWRNVEAFKDAKDIIRVLKIMDRWDNDDSRNTAIMRIARHFKERNPKMAGDIPTNFTERNNEFIRNTRRDDDDEDDDDYDFSMPVPSIKNIDRGRRGEKKPSTNLIYKLNDASLVGGEFYNDISRIPPSAFNSFLRSWLRLTSKLKNLRDRMLGRPWRQSFLLGYDMGRKMVIEIWYDAATSTFMIYDRNGVLLNTPPARTLQEALGAFVTFLLRRGGELDKDIFHGRSRIAREFSSSYMRALTNELGKDKQSKDRANKMLDQEISLMQSIKKKDVGVFKGLAKSVTGGAKASANLAQQGYAASKNIRAALDEPARRVMNAVKDHSDAAQRAMGYSTADAYAPGARPAQKGFIDRMIDAEDSVVATANDMKNAATAAYINASNAYQEGERAAKAFYNSVVAGKAAKAFAAIGLSGALYSNYRYMDEVEARELRNGDPAIRMYIDVIDRKDQAIRQLYGEIVRARAEAKIAAARAEREAIRARIAEKEAQLKRELQEREASVAAASRIMGSDIFGSADDQFSRSGRRGSMFESIQQEQQMDENFRDADSESFDAASYELDREAINRRVQAQNHPATVMMIKNAISTEMLEQYDETKLNSSDVKKMQAGLRPGSVMGSIFNSMKMAILGRGYRADFVIGFSLKNIVNIEIWYVTEPDRKNPFDMISSYYVYDATAKKVVRANLPYYRNAITIAMAKIGVQ